MGRRRREPNGAEWLTTHLCRAYEADRTLGDKAVAPLAPLPVAFSDAKSYWSAMRSMTASPPQSIWEWT